MVGWFGRKPKAQSRQVPLPRVNFTPPARQQLEMVLARQASPAALRILVKNPGAGAPQYDMALESADAQGPGDTLVDAGGLRVVVDAASLSAVEGATVDFRDDPLQPGFLVEPPRIGVPDAFDAADPLAAQVQAVLEHHVNPGIASHGGHADLVGVKDDVVYVALGGGCQGCSMASVTLKQGIEQILKQAIPRIKAVVDATDHAHGNNPFYTADKAGESPFHQAAKA
ncbi:MAG TPA: NifU family protein [Chloroflexota bacterium]|nr:NifU family protein [Chloroflexota bacterium]